TLAAEVLAHDLGLDLWRIDLSQMVSKYIGETEKNLRAIFDAAENTGSILLFDEADALFGRRSEVRDSHDRYANIEVSYLLQRIESYRGLAILTSNLRVNLDSAFLRRITFLVAFPFPDQTMRGCIWERMFPSAMPSEISGTSHSMPHILQPISTSLSGWSTCLRRHDASAPRSIAHRPRPRQGAGYESTRAQGAVAGIKPHHL